ncbi:MAG: DUF58 domain-containing protein [Archangium gephyra]|uniref:DUF58 domain-containing protein n=1 Tax=Archangium gephyra TaxID=48 RepID=A0A2W5TVG2_9BACT|nr:MAG: DUF58 domain-containing protein [Archangium gephyra]
MLLDPATLSRIAGLKLRARAVVEGVLSGLHKSPHQGQSVEFAEHKEYAPGDELRHLDWKAFGKFDKYYVKRFEHETNLRAVMVVDTSGSMGFGTAGLSKLDVARVLSASLAHLLVRQQDAAGVALIAQGRFAEVPPRAAASHLSVVLDALETATAKGQTDLVTAADTLAEKLPNRSLVCVFSDFFDERADALKRILALRSRKHDVAVFHLVDPAELTFPFDDPTLFTSMEDERRIEVNPREIKESYLEEFNRFLATTRDACRAADCDYELVRTDEPVDQVLLRFIGRRGGRL